MLTQRNLLSLLYVVLVLAASNAQAQNYSREAFIRRDRNVDGQLSTDEFLLGRQGVDLALSRTAFREIDLDNSQSLGLNEFIGFDAANYVTAMERDILTLTNAKRAAAGFAPVKLSRVLSNYARQWSQMMANHQVEFGHGVEGTPTDGGVRRRQASLAMDREYSGGSENVHRHNNEPTFTDQQHANRAVESWMDSPGHRKNMLNPEQEYIGIGVAASNDGDLYFTQIYLKLPRDRRP